MSACFYHVFNGTPSTLCSTPSTLCAPYRVGLFASSFSRCPYYEPRAVKGEQRGYLVVGVFHPDQMNRARLKKQFNREMFRMGEMNGKTIANKGY